MPLESPFSPLPPLGLGMCEEREGLIDRVLQGKTEGRYEPMACLHANEIPTDEVLSGYTR